MIFIEGKSNLYKNYDYEIDDDISDFINIQGTDSNNITNTPHESDEKYIVGSDGIVMNMKNVRTRRSKKNKIKKKRNMYKTNNKKNTNNGRSYTLTIDNELDKRDLVMRDISHELHHDIETDNNIDNSTDNSIANCINNCINNCIEKNEINSIREISPTISISNKLGELKIEDIFINTMSDLKGQGNNAISPDKLALMEKLREVIRINEDLTVITKLDSNNKLWVETKSFDATDLKGNKISQDLPCLTLDPQYMLKGVIRWWNSQGREPILAHIDNMIKSIEEQTEFEKILERPVIPKYTENMMEAADKMDNVLANTYPNFKEDIKDYVQRLRNAATKMRVNYDRHKK